MTPLMLFQLLVALGPTALELIPKLAALWGKQDLTVEEVTEICKVSHKPYDQGLAEAKARLGIV